MVGMGEKKTKEALAKACDEFKILDLIYKEAEEEETEVQADLPEEAEEVQLLDDDQDDILPEEAERGCRRRSVFHLRRK